MNRIGVLSAAAGLTGWAARLLFASGLGCAIVGVHIALFQSLGHRDPGPLWISGLVLIGSGAAGSLAGFITVMALRSERRRVRMPADPGWYIYPWILFLGATVALLCLSCGLRLVGDWQRSDTTVVATASGCSSDTGDSGTSYSCTYDWDWNGVHHRQDRQANGQYEDGHLVQLWIDPVTGGADDHAITAMTYSFIGAGIVGLFDLFLSWVIAREVAELRGQFGAWCRRQVWWSSPPERRAGTLEPQPAESAIDDAHPPYASAVVEDARPPGY